MKRTVKVELIDSLSDGKRSAREIAELAHSGVGYVRRVQRHFDFPRLGKGAMHGERNHGWVGGHIELDGYRLTHSPEHPHCRGIGVVLEHRLVMENTLSRYLLPTEVVDHIDGLTLHNDPSNLRVFQQNGDHLSATITGRKKQISRSGLDNIKAQKKGLTLELVDTYRLRKARGDVRLRQILLAALKLGIDSPHLSGTNHWLTQAQIDYSQRSSLELALAQLESRYAADLLL